MVARNIALVLRSPNRVPEFYTAERQLVGQKLSDFIAGHKNGHQAANHIRAAPGFGWQRMEEPVQRAPSILVVRDPHRPVVLRHLDFAEDAEHMFFAWKIIEESAFAHVSRVGDVFYGCLVEAVVAKQIHGSAKQPLPRFTTTPLATPHLLCPSAEPGQKTIPSVIVGFHDNMTIGHK